LGEIERYNIEAFGFSSQNLKNKGGEKGGKEISCLEDFVLMESTTDPARSRHRGRLVIRRQKPYEMRGSRGKGFNL